MKTGELTANSKVPGMKGELRLPDKIDPEIKAMLDDNGFDLSVRVKMDGDMINAEYHYCRRNAGKDGQNDWRDASKSFKSWEDFTELTKKFFDIAKANKG